MAKNSPEQQEKAVGSTATRKAKIGEVSPVEKDYRVISDGFQEDFNTRAAAMEQVLTMKKLAIKSEEPIKVTVKEVIDGKVGKTTHQLVIGESYYK